jgi:hypothetical protein
MSLPMLWVDKIFTKLGLVYGRALLSQYEGFDIDDVKADWAHELAGYENHPESIAFALQNLPIDRPPNVLQFRAMCRRAPPPVFKALPTPEPTPEQRAKVRQMIDGLRKKMTAGGM